MSDTNEETEEERYARKLAEWCVLADSALAYENENHPKDDILSIMAKASWEHSKSIPFPSDDQKNDPAWYCSVTRREMASILQALNNAGYAVMRGDV